MKLRNKIFITTALATLSLSSAYFSINQIRSYEFKKIVENDNQNNVSSQVGIIAHRGFSSMEIENSYEAISLALQTPYIDEVELDIQVTEDEVIVLSHNGDINGKNINESSYEELRDEEIKPNLVLFERAMILSLVDSKSGFIVMDRVQDLMSKKTFITTLSEILELNKEYQKPLIIDVKDPDIEEIETIYNTIKDTDPSLLTIQCTSPEFLREMRNRHPEFIYNLIINKKNYNEIYNEEFDGYVIRFNLVNYDDINNLIKHNKKISIWTVDNSIDYNGLHNELGDLLPRISLITDFPDVIRTLSKNVKEPKPKQLSKIQKNRNY